MDELVEFQAHRIIALQDKVSALRKENYLLEQYIIEICDKDCPDDYKRVIKQLILNQDN